MTTPYRRWTELLDRFAAGDDTVLPELADARLAWQSGVAERVSRRISAAMTARLEELRRRLQRDLDAGDAQQIGPALVRARRALQPLVELSRLPSLPPEIRGHLDVELHRVVADLQDALERSARPTTGSGAEVLAQVRRHRLTAVLSPACVTASVPEPPAAGPRRLIL